MMLNTPLVVGAILPLSDASTLVEIFLSGLAKASIYIMITLGLTLVFGLMGVINFAHGSMTMLGAYLGGAIMVLLVSSGTGDFQRVFFLFIAMAIVFGILSILGAVTEVGFVQPLYDRSIVAQLLMLFGLLLIIEEMVRICLAFYDLNPTAVWREALFTKPEVFNTKMTVGVVSVNPLHLFQIVVGASFIIAVGGFLTKTKYGLYIRAGSEDSEMAEALGIDISRVFTLIFAIGTGITGIAGVLLMWDPTWGASVPMSLETLLIAFVVIIIGGLGSFKGTLYAGLIIGMVDAVMVWLFQNLIQFPNLPEITLFALLVLTLVIRPKGLFGVEEVGEH